MRWFTTDLHFGHRNVIDFCERPYKNVEEMDASIIKQWNSQVAPTDEVWFLGDFGINKRKCLDKDLVDSLNGRKFIIIGNHDSFFVRGHESLLKFENQYREKYYNAGWEGAYLDHVLDLKDGTQVNLTHLPPSNIHDNRYSSFKIHNNPNEIYLHGHLHGHYLKKDNLIDVSFDANLILMSEQDVIDTINDPRTFIPTRLTKNYQEVSLFLRPFEDEVKKKNLRKVAKGDLVLYNYTDQCTYERAWNEVTRASRGIILSKTTGKIVALPFPKFFNTGEMIETRIENLPDEPYTVSKKMDGSLGIIYHHDGEWRVATRGSFSSDQAQEGKKMLDELYDMSEVPTELTLLTEIIYPENKIVANYGDERKLVLLSAVNIETQKETDRKTHELVCRDSGMELVEEYNYTIKEMIELQKTLPKDEEGFVVRFESGLRIKMKGAEYCRIHKMIAQMSPLSFWESMEQGKVNIDYLQELPEEYRTEAEELTEALELKFSQIKADILSEYNKAPTSTAKGLGLYIQQSKHKYAGAFFSIFNVDADRFNKFIMRYIRPNGNQL